MSSGPIASPRVSTILFIGAGRHQRRAIRRARELGLRAVAAVRTLHEGKEALQTVGLPAVLKPADSAGQRGLFLLRSVDDLEAHLHVALIESASEEAIVESFHEGLELNGLVVARGGEPQLVTLSDRLRPDGAGFGVALAHVYPSTLFGDALEEAERVATRVVRALGLRDGVAYPQLLVTEEGETLLLEVAARVPAGQMDQVARRAVGVDLVQVALRQALGEQVPDELVRPQFQQPLAISFLTAEPGPLPTGKVRSVGPLERVLAFPGVLEAEVYLAPGDVIDPVQRDGDRKGFVIARGDTNIEALERAEAAATLIDVEVEPE